MQRYTLSTLGYVKSRDGEVVFYRDIPAALAAARLQGWREGNRAAHKALVTYAKETRRSIARTGGGTPGWVGEYVGEVLRVALNRLELPEPDYSEEGTP